MPARDQRHLPDRDELEHRQPLEPGNAPDRMRQSVRKKGSTKHTTSIDRPSLQLCVPVAFSVHVVWVPPSTLLHCTFAEPLTCL